MSTRMSQMIEQVLDEIQLEEGENTEVTVSSVRGMWDNVHPGIPVPSPGTVRNNLQWLEKSGRLKALPNGKSWMFAVPVAVPEDDEELELEADTAASDKAEWELIQPSTGLAPEADYEVSIRFAPEVKTPYIAVRIPLDKRDKYSERLSLAYSKTTRQFALVEDERGYKVPRTTENRQRNSSVVQFRIIGSAADKLFALTVFGGSLTLYFNSVAETTIGGKRAWLLEE